MLFQVPAEASILQMDACSGNEGLRRTRTMVSLSWPGLPEYLKRSLETNTSLRTSVTVTAGVLLLALNRALMGKNPYILESDVDHLGKTHSKIHAQKKTALSITFHRMSPHSPLFAQTPTLKPGHWDFLSTPDGHTCCRVWEELFCVRRGLRKKWWHTPLIPALGRQWQVDCCEFKASQVYKGQSRLHRETLSQKPKRKEKRTLSRLLPAADNLQTSQEEQVLLSGLLEEYALRGDYLEFMENMMK